MPPRKAPPLAGVRGVRASAASAATDRPTTLPGKGLPVPQSTDRSATRLPRQGLPPQSTDRARSKPSDIEKKGATSVTSKQDQIQIKTFVRWWNATAELPVEHQIIDLTVGLASCEVPLIALSRLTGKDINYHREPKSRLKIIENGKTFLKELKALGVKATASAEDIADGKRALLLALTWKLVMHFSSRSSSDAHPNELLMWLKTNTGGATSSAKVEDWKSSSLLNGKAFLAILEAYEPGCIAETTLAFEPPGARAVPGSPVKGKAQEDAEVALTAAANLQLAFDTAHCTFGVPKLLDAADLIAALNRHDASEANTANSGIDLKSLQAYASVLRHALRSHVELRRFSVLEDCAAFKEEARAISTWAGEAAEMLCGLQSEVSVLERRNPEHIHQAEIMLADLDAEWREKSKVVMIDRTKRLREVRLPAACELLREIKTADERISDKDVDSTDTTAPASNEDEMLSKESAASAAALAVAEAELMTALNRAEASIQSVAEAEGAFSSALWEVLVEKRTDMLVNEAEETALKVGEYIRVWAAKLAASPALKFDAGKGVWPESGGDASLALARSVELLGKWAGSGNCAATPGVQILAELKESCLSKHAEGTMRRAREGREAAELTTEELRASLETEWEWMTVHADVLRSKCMPLLVWQREQFNKNANSLAKASRSLEKHLPPAPTTSMEILFDELPDTHHGGNDLSALGMPSGASDDRGNMSFNSEKSDHVDDERAEKSEGCVIA